MILSLIGPDDYRREQRKLYLIEEFRKKYGLHGAERFSATSKEQRDRFHELVFSPSLFAVKRLAIIEDVFECDDKEFIKDLKQAANDQTLWVFIAERAKTPSVFKFITQKPATYEEFSFLEGEEWKRFILHEAKVRNMQLDPEVVRLLLRLYKDDTWRLVTELDRLASLGHSVRVSDLQIFDGQSEFNLWGILSQLRGESVHRLRALEKIFMSQEPAAKIFNILAAQAGQDTPQFAAYDVAIKSGKLEYEEALLDFVLPGK